MNESLSLQKLISVIVPIFNEEENLVELHTRLSSLMERLSGYAFEILLISDGSTDQSNQMITGFSKEDSRFRGAVLSRNFGHQAAVNAGMFLASGDLVAIIDGDLQDPPEVLAEMVGKIESGFDVVYGVRCKRKEGWCKRLCYWAFYRLLGKISNVPIAMDAGDFCCMRKVVVEAIKRQPEKRRFMRGMRSWVGFRQTGLEYERHGRFAGKPKYSLRALIRLAYSGLFGFSSIPIKVMQFLGLTSSFVAVLVGFIYFVLAFISDAPQGFPSLMVSIWFLAGIQLFFMGLIGEYIYRTYEQSLRREDYLISELVGFENR